MSMFPYCYAMWGLQFYLSNLLSMQICHEDEYLTYRHASWIV